MSLSAMRFRNPLGAGMSDKNNVSWDIVSMFVLGQGTSPFNASLDSGENEYLIGQRWQCVRSVQCDETAAGLYALRGNGTRMNRSSDQGVKCKVG